MPGAGEVVEPEADDAEPLYERGLGPALPAHGVEKLGDEVEAGVLGVLALARAEGEEAVEGAAVGVEREGRAAEGLQEAEPGGGRRQGLEVWERGHVGR